MEFRSLVSLLLLAIAVTCSPQQKRECDEKCATTSKSVELQSGIDVSLNVVKFYLYNKNLKEGSDGCSVFDTTSFKRAFDKFEAKKETKIIIHGWLDNLNSSINIFLKDVYLMNYDYNIIIMDWSGAGSMNPLYPVARSRVPIVADQLSVFVDSLCIQYHVKPGDLHIIGHSLGAHIAGIAGKKVESGSIGRITGLDPAGPLFSSNKPEERISNSSALFVDVIHTCGIFLGTTYQMGHADFYPNNGKWIQPGCYIDLDGVCSHARSYLYFTESIKYPFGYQSTPCSNWDEFVSNKCEKEKTVAMGAFVPTTARGSYYLMTNSEPPFFQL